MNSIDELERFNNLVLEYNKIDDKYKIGSQISQQKKELLLWQLDSLRDEICYMKKHLDVLLKKKDELIHLITTPESFFKEEKDEQLELLFIDNQDLSYNISVNDFLNELYNELNLEEEDIKVRIVLRGKVDSECSNINDYINKAQDKYGIDYTTSIPILLYIHIKDTINDDIILSWNTSLYDIQNNNKKLIDLVNININDRHTRLKYIDDYNNLVINCCIKDLFNDLMSENEEYDELIRNIIINVIRSKLSNNKVKIR